MPARQRLCAGCAGDVLAVQRDGAGIGRRRAGDQREQRGLAGAVRADDAQRLALGDASETLSVTTSEP